MCKLSFVCSLGFLIAVPAAVATTGASAHKEDHSLISSPLFDDPMDAHATRSRGPAAKRDVARNISPRDGGTAVSPRLQAIAACESGGDPTRIGGDGAYRGKYQFSPATWQAIGGTGDPAAAPEGEQDRRAAILYARSGPSQWPACAAG